ncbi:MAG: site-2 protease family protein [Candidatus Pacearchaeota archaeon]
MSFFIYDIIFLIIFLVLVSTFLYKRKDNLKREGLLYLYKTTWGIKLINRIGKKYKKTINLLSYFSILSGFFLMVGMIYLTYVLVKVYFFNPEIVRTIKIPPILPLVPYLPQVFKLEFLPPFYFTYWILIIAIIAITHEMAHGIFAAYNKIKIKNTGFGFFPYFFPIFLAAFVEPEEKIMNKKSRFSQMAVLSAGTFANVIVAIFFFIILIIFSFIAFTPSGVIFDRYAEASIPLSGISSINNISLNNPSYDQILNFTHEVGFNELKYNGKSYLATKDILEKQKGSETISVYYSAPAIKNNLSSIITEINGVKVKSISELILELKKYSPGDEIEITTLSDNGPVKVKILLEENPRNKGDAWLGIAFLNRQKSGFLSRIGEEISPREPHVYYKPLFDGASVFFYNLIWWVIIISSSVALINMLPVGIFDGGRFFYLGIWSITKNEKIAKRLFEFTTKFFLILFLLIVIFWGISFFR